MIDEPHFSLQVDQEITLCLLGNTQANELFRLVEQDRQRLRKWLPWVDYERSPADSLAYIQRTQQQFKDQESLQLGLFYQGQLAGTIGSHTVNWPNRSVEIGYWLSSAWEGRGVMTRACRGLIQYTFTSLNINRVEIQCATGNVKSRAIPERLGFVQEGVRRESEWLNDHFVDLVLYGMLAHEWSTKNRNI
jgi:ribosomal-protein-serine acetyltransferase